MNAENLSHNSETISPNSGFDMSDVPEFDPDAATQRIEEEKRRIQNEAEKQGAKVDGALSPQSDKTVESIFNKLGRGANDGYFGKSDQLVNLVSDALSKTPQQVIDGFKSEVNAYAARSTENYRDRAHKFYEETRDNVQNLSRQGLVGNDTIKVFLSSQYISEANDGRGRFLSEYNAIQAETSRKDTPNSEVWANIMPTADRYQYRVKELADGYALRGGDVAYQKDAPEQDVSYNADPDGRVIQGTFIHINSNKPRAKGGLRCYISPDMTKDPSAVLLAWNESINASPLRDELYFKFNTSLNRKDSVSQRPDSIVIYKTDNIDDGQFGELLQDFQQRCNEMSPELLPSDDKRMPTTTRKIANGISIAGEPNYVNDYMRYVDRKEGKHSWTTFIDKMTLLSTSVAANRLGVTPNSIETPGLEEETKKVFREFMLLSKINPDTMLPQEYGDTLPSWANLSGDVITKSKGEGGGDKTMHDVAENVDSVEAIPQMQPVMPNAEITQPQPAVEMAGNEDGQELKQKSDAIEQGRNLMSTGEASSIFAVEKPDGKRSTQLESEYFDRAARFRSEHPEIKDNFDLKLAMSGFVTDLALVDATNGSALRDREGKIKANMLEDYATLHDMLDDVETSSEDKQAINEYFNTLDGNALRQMEEGYNTQKQNAENPVVEEKRAKVELQLEDARAQLEKARSVLDENAAMFDDVLSKMDELVGSRSIDIDSLQDGLNRLHRISEELRSSMFKFIESNISYEEDIARAQSYLGEDARAVAKSGISANEDYAMSIAKKSAAADDKIAAYKNYISKVDALLEEFKRF